MSRGMLTQEIIDFARGKIGGELTRDALRLVPYLQFCCVNQQCVDIAKINTADRAILMEWKKRGFVDGGISEPIAMTKEFWDFCNDILWQSYAVQKEAVEL